jgi:hypothetical protein
MHFLPKREEKEWTQKRGQNPNMMTRIARKDFFQKISATLIYDF